MLSRNLSLPMRVRHFDSGLGPLRYLAFNNVPYVEGRSGLRNRKRGVSTAKIFHFFWDFLFFLLYIVGEGASKRRAYARLV